MLKYFKQFVFLALLMPLSVLAQDAFFQEANTFFKTNVAKGQVNYSGIKASPSLLNNLVEQIAAHQTGSRNDFPFYLNAYNILVIKQVVDNYPIASPMDIAGFFDKTTFTIAGKTMTLNALENEVIRPKYGDPRIHFALVCAAQSCPKLYNEAFTPENYNKLLDRNTRNAINDANFTQINEGSIALSKIFEWYKIDFGNSDKGVLEFVNQYLKKTASDDIQVNYYDYIWRLNGY